MIKNSYIYTGNVIHKRFKPKIHSFNYNVFSLLIDLSEINLLHKTIRIFSHNKLNIISYNNDINNYLSTMLKTREIVAVTTQPQVLEVEVHSLGGFYVAEDQDSKRYINYHAGAIKIEPDENGIFENGSNIKNYINQDGYNKIIKMKNPSKSGYVLEQKKS